MLGDTLHSEGMRVRSMRVRKKQGKAGSVAVRSTVKSRARSSLAAVAAKGVDTRELRARLKLSQPGFAKRYGISLVSLRNWEQGRSQPDPNALVFLGIISRNPEYIAELVALNSK